MNTSLLGSVASSPWMAARTSEEICRSNSGPCFKSSLRMATRLRSMAGTMASCARAPAPTTNLTTAMEITSLFVISTRTLESASWSAEATICLKRSSRSVALEVLVAWAVWCSRNSISCLSLESLAASTRRCSVTCCSSRSAMACPPFRRSTWCSTEVPLGEASGTRRASAHSSAKVPSERASSTGRRPWLSAVSRLHRAWIRTRAKFGRPRTKAICSAVYPPSSLSLMLLETASDHAAYCMSKCSATWSWPARTANIKGFRCRSVVAVADARSSRSRFTIGKAMGPQYTAKWMAAVPVLSMTSSA
mmetsp:Transcript_23958/g.56741  ORF Transcript_23958/g.56741 Transcript_23958/m.56741 type:complete len:306 (+) Transcript_23958:269-1186(+)